MGEAYDKVELAMETNSNVYLADALQYFFKHASFNISTINLLDYFPTLKRNEALSHTPIHLLNIYTYIHGLITDDDDEYIPDNVFEEAFGGDIPAAFYHEQSNSQNTFDIMSSLGVNYMNISSFKLLCTLNYFIATQGLNSRDEYELSKELYNTLSNMVNVYNLDITIDDLFLSASRLNNKKLLKTLVNDKKVDPSINDNEGLINAIINNDLEIVKLFLTRIEVDPRINNNEAYYFAIKSYNEAIINEIKEAISKRNYFERRVYEAALTPLEGVSELPDTLHSYTRGMFK